MCWKIEFTVVLYNTKRRAESLVVLCHIHNFIWSHPVFVRVQHVDAWKFSPDCYRWSILSQPRKANAGAKIDWKGLRGVGFLNIPVS